MSITLPENFRRSLGNTTALVPIVRIETGSETIRISTNSFTYNDEYYKPLLLNIPSLKESIDIEKRFYRISSIKLILTNYLYDNIRFSESVEGSLINSKVDIYWTSPATSNFVGDTSALHIYQGYIREYTHDDEKVNLTLEDRSQDIFHKDLPSPDNYLTDENVPDKYKNKPIPMVYGHVDRSPCILSNTVDAASYIESDDDGNIEQWVDLYVDNKTISGVVDTDLNNIHGQPVGSLYIFEDDEYLNIAKESKMGIMPENTQYINDPNNNYKLSFYIKTLDGIPQNFLSDGRLEVESIKKPFSAQGIWAVGIGAHFHKTINTENVLIDDSNFSTWQDYNDELGENPPFHFFGGLESAGTAVLWHMKSFSNIDLDNYNSHLYPLIKATIKNHDAATFASDHPSLSYDGTFNAIDLQFGTNSSIEGTDTSIFSTIGAGNTLNINTLGSTVYDKSIDYNHESGIAGFGWLYNAGELNSNYGFIEGEIKYLNFVERLIIKGIGDKDFYANVLGRVVGTDGTSPTAPQIINHLMTNELGYNAIDVPTDYNNWRYAFTVHKKINSKKLLEELSSSSPFIPYFDNNGNFIFNTIKKTYQENKESVGFTPFIEIKKADVISASFSRTPIEDVYTKVTLKYHYDYGMKDFSAEPVVATTLPNGYDRGYYGLEEDVELIVDDNRGKYIREFTTATNFAQWLLYWHCNQHLKIEIKLGLSYMNIAIGDILRFDEVIDVKPYNIDYSKGARWIPEVDTYILIGQSDALYGDTVNGQQVFPDFMCIKTSKNLDSVTVLCVQMHNLTSDNVYVGTTGCDNPIAWNYNPNVNIPDNSTCLIPPVNGLDASANFDQQFLITGVCPVLINDDITSPDFGDVATNYPEEEIDDFDVGESLYQVDDPPFYLDYDDNGQVAYGKAKWEVGLSVHFYRMSECIWADAVLNNISKLEFFTISFEEGLLADGVYSVGSQGLENPGSIHYANYNFNGWVAPSYPPSQDYFYYRFGNYEYASDGQFQQQTWEANGSLSINFRKFIFSTIGLHQPVTMKIELVDGYHWMEYMEGVEPGGIPIPEQGFGPTHLDFSQLTNGSIEATGNVALDTNGNYSIPESYQLYNDTIEVDNLNVLLEFFYYAGTQAFPELQEEYDWDGYVPWDIFPKMIFDFEFKITLTNEYGEEGNTSLKIRLGSFESPPETAPNTWGGLNG